MTRSDSTDQSGKARALSVSVLHLEQIKSHLALALILAASIFLLFCEEISPTHMPPGGATEWLTTSERDATGTVVLVL